VSLESVSPVKGLTGASGIATVIGRIIKAVLGTVGAFALLMFVYGGLLMLTSAGKSDQINKGKQVLVWAVIGLAMILASYTLTNTVIQGITGGVGGGTGTTGTGGGKCTDMGGKCNDTCEIIEIAITASDCAKKCCVVTCETYPGICKGSCDTGEEDIGTSVYYCAPPNKCCVKSSNIIK
jgi:hypothetical protein